MPCHDNVDIFRRALCLFLNNSSDRDLAIKNRVTALDYLRSLSENGALASQETCILALGNISR